MFTIILAIFFIIVGAIVISSNQKEKQNQLDSNNNYWKHDNYTKELSEKELDNNNINSFDNAFDNYPSAEESKEDDGLIHFQNNYVKADSKDEEYLEQTGNLYGCGKESNIKTNVSKKNESNSDINSFDNTFDNYPSAEENKEDDGLIHFQNNYVKADSKDEEYLEQTGNLYGCGKESNIKTNVSKKNESNSDINSFDNAFDNYPSAEESKEDDGLIHFQNNYVESDSIDNSHNTDIIKSNDFIKIYTTIDFEQLLCNL